MTKSVIILKALSGFEEMDINLDRIMHINLLFTHQMTVMVKRILLIVYV